MLTILLTEILPSKHQTKKIMALVILLFCTFILKAQQDSIAHQDSSLIVTDSLKIKKEKKESSILLNDKVTYNAKDSSRMDWNERKIYLYNEAYLKYEETELTAAYIEIDFENNKVIAYGLPDSTGKLYGNPVYKDGEEEVELLRIEYDMKTKKGIVYDVTKQEGDIYTYVRKGKKMPDNTMYVEHGHFTTCSLPHPHFRIRYKKAKVIPNDKIVTGPIYMEIGDVPLPLVLPFGFFPNKRGRSNGLIIPSYGHSDARGYYLANGGYYTGLGEQMDLSLLGDFYSKKSWGVKIHSNYNVRYKYDGFFDIQYADNKSGETDTKFFNSAKTFFVKWKHQQSNLANPNSSFSANVNFGSSSHNQQNSYNTNNRLSNSFSSNVAYSTRLWGKYNFSINAGHSQNTGTQAISVNLPSIAFSTPRFTPFKSKSGVAKKSQLRNLTVSYRMNAKNQLNTYDSLFMDSKMKDFMNGVEHSVPVNLNMNFGFINWNTSLNYKEKWYFQTLDRYYQDSIITSTDTIVPQLVNDMISGFKAARSVNLNTSFETKLFTMVKVKKGPLKAMRYVLTPTVGFNYIPDVSEWFGLDYYQTYIDQVGTENTYSIFNTLVYGGPSQGHSGRVTLGLNNNLEIKVKSKKDTVKHTRKIKLIEAFNIGTYYDLARDSFNMAPLSLTARTTLFKGMTINYAAVWDFYALNDNGRRINEFNWDINKKLMRNESGQWRLAFQYSLNPDMFKEGKGKKPAAKPLESQVGTQSEINDLNNNRNQYVDFNVPWSLNFSYDFDRLRRFNYSTLQFDTTLTQTLRFNGDINITKKWKVGVSSGYDFKAKKLSYTTVDIYRDLHCWEMMFNWVPLGNYKRYELTIRVKSPVLQDLKLNKKKDWRDY